MDKITKSILQKHEEYVTYFVWLAGWASIFGSLYFSEIKGFIPCELCWWQRLLIYPLAIFATVAIIRKEYKNFAYYVLPFSVVGLIVSGYHSLLQWGIIEHNLLDCSEGAAVSCSNPEIMVFGFITIPFLAFLAFGSITLVSSLSLYLSAKQTKK
jgi:disulfide bond formation protein DsbB